MAQSKMQRLAAEITEKSKETRRLKQYVWVLLAIIGAFALKYWRVL